MNEPDLIRVLLVTDSPFRRYFGQRILSLAGDMEALSSIDGREGLELARSFHPHVILLDAVLPGISGLELLRRYRAGGGEAKVLVLVKSHLSSVCDAACSAGADLILLEPTQWGELIRHIRAFADGPARRCRALLLDMGAPEAWAGFSQTVFCVRALLQDPRLLLKQAYVEAAARDHTTPACVEINIRRLIARVHTLDFPAYRSLPELSTGKGPPSNRDFLRSLVQAVRFPL